MFGREKRPKSYLNCPYCGHAPMALEGKCTYHNPRHTVYRYECELGCLKGEVCWSVEKAFDSWIRIVARYYDAEDVLRKHAKQRRNTNETV